MLANHDTSYPHAIRLCTPAQYKRVFKKGYLIKTPAFICYNSENTTQCARLGVIVSKKSAKKAVDRNRIKRLCKEAFRFIRVEMASKDYVLVARPLAKTLSNEQLKAFILTCLR